MQWLTRWRWRRRQPMHSTDGFFETYPKTTNEMLALAFILFGGALFAGCRPEDVVGSPQNITVHVIDSKTVEVFWATTWKNVERYDVTYKPAEDRIVTQAAGSSQSIVLRELRPNTQYQVTVSAIVNGKNYKSRRLVFKTGNVTEEVTESGAAVEPRPTIPSRPGKGRSPTPEAVNPDPTAVGSKYTPQTSTTVRGVEVGLVLLALVVWIIAISLFFHRWGKIRMLLPYQPDYKTQQSLKVPGTGTTSSSGRGGNGVVPPQQEGPGCVQSIYEKVTACRCCCKCISAKRRWSMGERPGRQRGGYSKAVPRLFSGERRRSRRFETVATHEFNPNNQK